MKKIIIALIFCMSISLIKPGIEQQKTAKKRIADALKIISLIGANKEQTSSYNNPPFQNPGEEKNHYSGCFFCCSSSEDHYKQ